MFVLGSIRSRTGAKEKQYVVTAELRTKVYVGFSLYTFTARVFVRVFGRVCAHACRKETWNADEKEDTVDGRGRAF